MNKRTTCALLSVLVLLLVMFATTGTASATTFSTPVDADYGHVSNSVYLSQDDFPDGAPAAVLTSSENCPDSLTATVLAKAANGPLLLTSSTSLSTSVRNELVRLRVTNVFIVGLSTTIVNAVKTALPTLTPEKIVVLAGSDRYQTAALVARKVKELAGDTPARVFIVPGDVYGSSLAAAAVAAANGWPILLTPAAGPFPSASAQAIAGLGVKTGIRVDTSVDPGVSGFTIEKTIMGTTSATDDPGARYTEALAMAEYAVQQGWATYTHLALGEEQGGSVAYSENFPDNVLLASHIAREGGAYLLSKSTALHSTVVNLLKGHGKDIDSVDFMRPDYDQVLSGAWSFGAIRQVKSLNSPRVTGLSKTSGPLAGGGVLTVSGSGFTGAKTVRIGKTDLPDGSWTVNSDTSITVDALPAATQQGAAEILVYNYWHVNPSNPKDVYFYLSGTGPALAAMKVAQEAVKYLGVPYVWAGAGTGGFDCSGFTMYLYNKFKAETGISLPHKSTYQANYGTPVEKDDLLPGDLVFFNSPISHVGMYVGNGLMINAPRSGDLVTIEDVFRSGYATARRLISPPYTKVENTSTLLAYGGAWGKTATTSASGGSYSYSDASGASVSVTFNGIHLRWISKKSPSYGLTSVYVDGKPAGTVNLYSSTTQYKLKVWDTGVLPPGTHTVTIKRNGASGGGGTHIGLDTFEVIGNPVLAKPLPTVTRYQDTDSRIMWTGLWDNAATASASGGCLRQIGKAGSASVTFDGTSFSWLAKKDPSYGIAKVRVDGVDAGTADLYSSTASYVQTVWSTNTLVPGRHTVTIEWTGDKNAAATGTTISLDAFDILGTPVKPEGLNRFEETDNRLGRTGTWEALTTTGSSGGSYLATKTNGSSVTVNFTGTYLSWLATAGPTLGKAYVSLDGGAEQSIDLARSAVVPQQSVWATGSLDSGPHTVTIRWNPGNATGRYISVDAFDLMGGLTQAPTTGSIRYDQTSGNIVRTGTWANYSTTAAYLGSYGRSSSAGAKATIYFAGTKIAWIGMKGLTPGIIDVYIDDVKKATLDLYASPARYQVTLFASATLANGTHHMDLVRNSASLSTEFIVFDAVDIWGIVKAGP